MKRLVALLIATLAAALVAASPVPQLATVAASGSTEHLDARMMNYANYGERFEIQDTYRAYLARSPKNVVNLYYMGSSDITHGGLANPGQFIPKYLPGFDLYLSGRPYAQSLYHTMELAAVAPMLPNQKVVYHISPQYFTTGGPVPEGFRSVFSWTHWFTMLENPNIPDGVKDRIRKRAFKLYPELCTKYAQCGPQPLKTQATTLVKSIGSQPGIKLARLAEEHKSLKFSAKYSGSYSGPDVAPKPIPAKFWDDKAAEFLAESKKLSTNPFTVPDFQWNASLEEMTHRDRGKHAKVGYGDSDEYLDFVLFLEVARALNIKVMVAMTPPSAKWLRITQMSDAGKDAYYSTIKSVLAKYPEVKLADFSQREDEDYYFEDQMHLWMTGWTHLLRACYEFALE